MTKRLSWVELPLEGVGPTLRGADGEPTPQLAVTDRVEEAAPARARGQE